MTGTSRCFRWWAALGVALLPAAQAAEIVAYNSYLRPPFWDERRQTGLAADLLAYLNTKLAGRYHFTLKNVPRARLTRLILQPAGSSFDGVALFLHPRFVDDAQHKNFLWSRPLATDANVLVFSRPLPADFAGIASLRGLKFGGVNGNRYQVLDALVAAGSLQREDSASEAANLAKLLAHRVDFTQMNRASFVALSRERGFEQGLIVVAVPGEAPFNRHILLGRNNQALLSQLNQVIDGMAADPVWRKIAAGYQMQMVE